MVRILLLDHEELTRAGLAKVLNAEDGLHVSGEAESLDEAVEFLRMSSVHVVVMDAALLGSGSLGNVAAIKEAAPDCGLLVLNGRPDDEFGLRVIRAGADGYLTKDHPSVDLVAAVRRVADGKYYIMPRIAERLIEDMRSGSSVSRILTDREFEILQLTSRGLSGTEIAQRLGVTPQTVSTHRSRIRGKLGLQTVADLVRYAIDHGIE